MNKVNLHIFIFCLFTISLFSQNNNIKVLKLSAKDSLLEELYKNTKEQYFKFKIKDKNEIEKLTLFLSIDNVKKDSVFAYADKEGFKKFLYSDYEYVLLTKPSQVYKKQRILKCKNSKKKIDDWNFYPSYSLYEQILKDFRDEFPDFCSIDTIAVLSSGRKLLAAVIKDTDKVTTLKPSVILSGTIHGDEPLGCVLLLHLIDSILRGYAVEPEIKDMVKKMNIFICPLENPDGMYSGGDNNIYLATRFNANGVDINRNFPDPALGAHPDGKQWQDETVALMNYYKKIFFVLSGSIHGGAEVFNYPWDTWSRLHPDDAWWQCVGRKYVDTVHKYSPSGYFTDLDNGITNGYQWYTVKGGKQDYLNYFLHTRDATIEISDIKMPYYNNISNYWSYNYRSFFNFLRQVFYGINGRIIDSTTNIPVRAKIFIKNYDKDSSHIYSSALDGSFFRPLSSGIYNLIITAPGYDSVFLNNIELQGACNSSEFLLVKLNPVGVKSDRTVFIKNDITIN
ncbi:MAG: hypothetical protein KA792_08825, partial [Bacteroidales bacterium]|nr:hypothetical protein [Bacteroidales bacterium]